MADRRVDTKTTVPSIYAKGPWNLNGDARFGFDGGNSNQIQIGAGLMWQQNFSGVSYYIKGEYSYLNRDWKTLRHRALGTFRTDLHLEKLSKTLDLSLPFIGTVAYDNVFGLEPRATAGGGLWLDYKHPRNLFNNGFSVFFVEEYERGGGFPEKLSPTISLREFFETKIRGKVKIIADAFFVQSLTNYKDFRISFTPSLSVELGAFFSLNFGFGIEYTNLPRNPSIKKYDLNTTIGLGVNLGPKESGDSKKK